MAPDVSPDPLIARSRAAALAAARRRLALLKAGTLGAGFLTFGVLTAGIAGQVGAAASGGPAAHSSGQAQPADGTQNSDAVPGDNGGNLDGSGGNVNPGGGQGPINPAPGIVSGQS